MTDTKFITLLIEYRNIDDLQKSNLWTEVMAHFPDETKGAAFSVYAIASGQWTPETKKDN
jgi:hypothetical protein